MTTLRRAVPVDAPAIAALFRRVRRACLPYLPDLHTPAEDLAFFAGRVLPEQAVWVAEDEAGLLGFAAVTPGWLNHLYVEPAAHGGGVGSALLAAAAPEGEVRLWAFQRNARARRFYERRGFTVERLTDGADNEEREPDVLYVRTLASTLLPSGSSI